MNLYGPDGFTTITSERTIDLAAAAEMAKREEIIEQEHPAAGKDIEPGPGQVILLRDKQAEFIEKNGFAVPNPLFFRNKYAVVARIGAARPELSQVAWFDKGDTVLINTSLVEEVDMGGETVEIAPFSAIKARFIQKPVESDPED